MGIDDVSQSIGALTAEVSNLNRTVSKLFEKFDEHVKSDYEMSGVLKQLAGSHGDLAAEHKKVKDKVEDHEKIKQRAIGYGIASGVSVSGLIAAFQSFFHKGGP